MAGAPERTEPAISDSGAKTFIVTSVDPPRADAPSETIAAVARPLLCGALAAALLLWVAFYNGYPTVYPDTGGYLLTGARFVAMFPFRAPGYAIFTQLTSLGASGWLTVAVQALFIVFALFEACKYLLGGAGRFRDRRLLAMAALLAAFTSLPWETSQLMPDVFAGLVFLTAFLLAFDDGLRMAERMLLSAILAISISAHLSLLPIGALFIAGLALARLAGVWRAGGALPARLAAGLLLPVAAAGLWTATLNHRMGLGFRLSVSGDEFLLGSLFEKGLAADYLAESCPTKPYVACRHLNNLPKTPGQFLFWNPLLPDMSRHGDEVHELARETIAAYPLRFVAASGQATLRQFASFRTGDEIRETNSPNSNALVIRQVFAPRDAQDFSSGLQIRGRMKGLANAAARLDTAVFWLSLPACLLLAWKGRAAGARRVNEFFCAALAFLVLNAAVCATFAGVYDRYQSRVAWILPLCLLCYVFRMRAPREAAERAT